MKYTYKYDLLPTVIINLIATLVILNMSVIAHVGGVFIGMICSLIFCAKLNLSK